MFLNTQVKKTTTGGRTSTKYEMVPFENHTECHCVHKISTPAPPRCPCPDNFNKTSDAESPCKCLLNCSPPGEFLCQQLKKGRTHFMINERQ